MHECNSASGRVLCSVSPSTALHSACSRGLPCTPEQNSAGVGVVTREHGRRGALAHRALTPRVDQKLLTRCLALVSPGDFGVDHVI